MARSASSLELKGRDRGRPSSGVLPVLEVWVLEHRGKYAPRVQFTEPLEHSPSLDANPPRWKATRFVPASTWLPWTQEAAEKLREGTVAWLCADDEHVLPKPAYWDGGMWMCDAHQGGKFNRLTHYQPISIPEGP